MSVIWTDVDDGGVDEFAEKADALIDLWKVKSQSNKVPWCLDYFSCRAGEHDAEIFSSSSDFDFDMSSFYTWVGCGKDDWDDYVKSVLEREPSLADFLGRFEGFADFFAVEPNEFIDELLVLELFV